jgi:alkylation response protein AidB-like acyl-CoA dehydrogenase
MATTQPHATDEYRERVSGWMQRIADEGLTAPGFPAIQQFGTRIHHERYLKSTEALELIGCFAMTETGNGSNVQQLGTTATYDLDTDELVLDTPTDDARKDYIGNAACHARMAAVFAQLIVAGESHGVHVLVAPIRDEDGNLHAGVNIEDRGEKMGLHGVDNRRIWVDHVRVPREALLDRYGGINVQGAHESPTEKPNKRFFTMLGALIQGRVCISGASISAAKTCRECCGGTGYMSINRFAALKADTDVFTRFEGYNTILMMLVGRGLLTDYPVDAREPGPVKDALGRMCDLHALHQIELDRGYVQEYRRLTGPRCKAITREVNRLCDELRGDAPGCSGRGIGSEPG